ncbi:hypothetical protein [Oceanobacillus sp. Castelsardo]|uniref:hypothetical protein n=1 Tax=Oceanobacillus sp. Castelsardo TaxID=1851204 RepID=UPI000837B6EC|nr:hypothetical protein [Oceanobacillus sp. Castelsardo]
MVMFLSIITIITVIIALIATMYIFKQEENKAKKYEAEGQTADNELERSHEYETKSVSYNLKNLSWIYVLMIVLSFIGLGIYIYNL